MGNWLSAVNSSSDISMAEYLFSYGTLQKPQVQQELFARSVVGYTDMLPGYRVSDIEIKDPVFLARNHGKNQRIAMFTGNSEDVIHGTVLEMTPSELTKADSYEPEDYERIQVVLQSGKTAWLYAAK